MSIYQRDPAAPGANVRRRDVDVPGSRFERAVTRFNASEAARTAAGLTRSMGVPRASVGAVAGSASEARVTMAWQLCWYQWGVDLADELRPVFLIDKGEEVEQLDRSARHWNARAGETGRLDLGQQGRSQGRTEDRVAEAPAKLVVNVDGGARGNPGPAAIAAVVQGPGGEVLEERGEQIGHATNNVAEYRALLLGIELAAAQGAVELELVGDSELVVKQVKGEYKVKDAKMRALHAEVKEALRAFDRWSIRHVRREQNAEADRLVNEALDG